MHHSFHLLIFLLGCLLSVPANSTTTFKAQNSIDGHWTFKEKSSATLVCSNYPYTGIILFVFNSTRVFGCIGSICTTTLNTFQDSFSFKDNTVNGIFTWNINNMQMKFNNIEIECHDGLSSLRYPITVKSGSTKGPQHNLSYIVLPMVISVIKMLL